MHEPKFWSLSRHTWHPYPVLLKPLSMIYHYVGQLRHRLIKPYTANKPVICIGNITMGGSGKTPVALMIADILKDMGESPAIISRGYGGSFTKPLHVNPQQHNAKLTGDEPRMMAQYHPVYIDRTRKKALEMAVQDGASILIMDDGLQNPHIKKNLHFIIVDGGAGFGNGHVLPSGPLRESPQNALKRADAIMIIDHIGRPDVTEFIAYAQKMHKIIFTATLKPCIYHPKRVFAYCGIRRSTKFFDMLKNIGFELAGTKAFSDHHIYTERDATALLQKAKKNNATLVTTEKDMSRIEKTPEQPALEQLSHHSTVICVQIICEQVTLLKKTLENIES